MNERMDRTRVVIGTVEGMELSIISRQDLLRNKKASARYRDLADAEILEDNLTE